MNRKTLVIGSLVFLGVSVGAYFYLKPKTATTAVGVSGGTTISNATTSNNAGTPALTTGNTSLGTIVNTLGSISNNTYTATIDTVLGTPIVTNVTSAPVASSPSLTLNSGADLIINSDNSNQTTQDLTKYNLAKSLANNVLSLSASAMLNVGNAVAYKKYEDAISGYISKINNLGYKLQDGVVVKI